MRVLAVGRSVCLCTGLFLVLSMVAAKQSLTYQGLLELSGVASHLQNVQQDVLNESTAAVQLCKGSVETVTVEAETLRTTHDGNVLVAKTADHLSRLIEPEVRTGIDAWFQSDLGKKVMYAEARHADLSALEFESQYKNYVASAALTKERFSKIRALRTAMRAAEFVTGLNTEITVAIRLLSACGSGEDRLTSTMAQIEDDREDQQLVSAFLGIGLDRDLSFVYSILSDQELSDFLEFAQSEAGTRYHNALVSVVNQVLREQNYLLKQKLFAVSD